MVWRCQKYIDVRPTKNNIPLLGVKKGIYMHSTIELDVGIDFSMDVLRAIIEKNKDSKDVKVTELYGSLQTRFFDIPSARPDFRLSSCNRQEFEKYVDIAKSNGIYVCYTTNAPFSNSVLNYHNELKKTIDALHYLEDIGIEHVIVSNPLLMEIISNYSNLKIKISTIQGVNRASSIKHYANYNVYKLCPDIYVNRNILLLKSLYTEAKKYGIELELLANEICLYGDTPCNNILRTACYTHSSLGGNPDALFNNWPFERCQAERDKYPICWLKIPYILPQYLQYYQEHTGINHFKITGRTNTHTYLLNTLHHYMNLDYSGKLQNLFMLPSNQINSNVSIYADHLNDFFDNLYRLESCDYKCESCLFCYKYGKSIGIDC